MLEHFEERRALRGRPVATGSFACPDCDAPVLPDGPLAPAARVGCPFCGHHAAARDFLSLASPARPARVAVRIVTARRGGASSSSPSSSWAS